MARQASIAVLDDSGAAVQEGMKVRRSVSPKLRRPEQSPLRKPRMQQEFDGPGRSMPSSQVARLCREPMIAWAEEVRLFKRLAELRGQADRLEQRLARQAKPQIGRAHV